jgi:hypothetical protein
MSSESISKDDLSRASREHNEETKLSENQIVAKELMPSKVLTNLTQNMLMKFV